MSKIKTHKDLDVWKQAMALAKEIYKVTANFPKEEAYGLVSQIRRAAVSIPSNVAEGAARNSDKEFIQFLIAQAKPFSYNYSVEERMT